MRLAAGQVGGKAAGDAGGVPAHAAQGVGGQAALPLKPDERQTRVHRGEAVAVAGVPGVVQRAETGEIGQVLFNTPDTSGTSGGGGAPAPALVQIGTAAATEPAAASSGGCCGS